MANQFVTLPAPAGNGSGAAVDVSTFGGLKTVTNSGSGGAFEPTVTIEFSNELVPVHFAPLWTFGTPGEKILMVAARWMRVTVSHYRGGGAPVVDMGGNDAGAQFANIPVPASAGVGAAVDISELDSFKTIHVARAFRGAVNIEISEDGGASFSQIASFTNPGSQSLEFIAEFVRVRRSGAKSGIGVPIVNIGAVDSGAGVAGIFVKDEGVLIDPNQFDTLNFIGGGVVATDAGGGDADILIPGITFEDKGVPIAGAPHDTLDVVGAGAGIVDSGGGRATLVVPGIIVEDEGMPTAGAPHFTHNFVGAGVTVTDGGGGVATITIPGGVLPPATGNAVLFWGCDDVGAAVPSRFLPPGHDVGLAPLTDTMRIPAPHAGTLKNLFVRHNSAGGNGNPVDYTVFVNGVATAITVSLVTGAAGQAGNTVNTVAVVQGAQISVRVSKNAVIAGGNVDVQVSLEVS